MTPIMHNRMKTKETIENIQLNKLATNKLDPTASNQIFGLVKIIYTKETAKVAIGNIHNIRRM